MAFLQAGKTIWSELFYIRILTLCLIGKLGSQNHPHSQSILPSAQPITKPLNCLVETETEEQIELNWNEIYSYENQISTSLQHTLVAVWLTCQMYSLSCQGSNTDFCYCVLYLGKTLFTQDVSWTDGEPVKMPMDNLWWSIIPNHCVREACCLIP